MRWASASAIAVTLIALGCARESTPTVAAQAAAPPAALVESARTTETRRWTIDGVEREAIVSLPPRRDGTSTPSPLVFVFHGHGGSASQVRKSYDAEREWPEAIFVYPQGLATPGALTDPQGRKSGWQSGLGAMDDRDLKFFDAMVADFIAHENADRLRVYCTGHSNGGGFTYLLWATRANVLAAVAPSAAAAGIRVNLSKPIPAMHVAGRRDTLVKFQWQEMTMQRIRSLNGCVAVGTPVGESGMLFASSGGTPVLLWITDSTHRFDRSCVGQMMDFFRQCSRNPA